MDEDRALRENRLRLLNRFVAAFADVADFGKMAKGTEVGDPCDFDDLVICENLLRRCLPSMLSATRWASRPRRWPVRLPPSSASRTACIEVSAEGSHVRRDQRVHRCAAALSTANSRADGRMLVFYTLVRCVSPRSLENYAASREDISGRRPHDRRYRRHCGRDRAHAFHEPGGICMTDQHYFRRIEAIEFTVAHDDGRNPRGALATPISSFSACRAPLRRLPVDLLVPAGLQGG